MDEQEKRFEQIYNNTKDAALRFITSKCLNICDIEDIYQETYLAVCRSLKNRTEHIDSEEAYVIAIAKRCISRHYSAMQKLKAFIDTGLSKLPDKALTEEVKAEEDIEQLTVDRQLLEDIFNIVASMPVDVQRIFYMYYVLDMKLADISARLNIPIASVKQKALPHSGNDTQNIQKEGKQLNEKELIRTALELKAPCPDELTAADILSSGKDKGMVRRRFPWLSVAVAAVLMISALGLYFYKHSDNRLLTDDVSEADDPGTVPSVQPVSNDEVIIWTDTDQTDIADDSFKAERVSEDYSDYVFYIEKNRFYCIQYTFSKDVPTNTYVLIDGERIGKVYLKDVTGDSKKEIFVETCPRDDIDETRIAVFNMEDKTMLNMYIEGEYTASMSVEDGKLFISDKSSVRDNRNIWYEVNSFDYSETYYSYLKECVKQGFERMRGNAENTFIHTDMSISVATESTDLSIYNTKFIQRNSYCLTNESAMKVFDTITDRAFIDSMGVYINPVRFDTAGQNWADSPEQLLPPRDEMYICSGESYAEYYDTVEGWKVLHVVPDAYGDGISYFLFLKSSEEGYLVSELAAMLSDPVSTSLLRETELVGNPTSFEKRLEDIRSYVSPDGKIKFSYTFEKDDDYIYLKILQAETENGTVVTDGGLFISINGYNFDGEENNLYSEMTFDEIKNCVGSRVKIYKHSSAYYDFDVTFKANTEEHPEAVTTFLGTTDYRLYGYAYSEIMLFN